ncbi:hypothetical protein NO932_06635 [Pelagibacterium sp. 26DY04]|uniref:hypothetical protein n=1 Tax=Pelagibacterium sp. 26DY04 TaxID=2967130 RepID=UPI002814F354|nr:hypothetical protein [Pelagibacterium sp. 26DY04]WMT88282.1 hypothetical protein NO932_06635 [Pelagibacterium sp. 26DY04]
MAYLWQNPLVPFIDTAGDPYSGAKAYFFDANTTTPKIVYEDSAFDIAHDHPVVADGYGRFPAIFLPTGDYRLRIEDANGATLWDVDGVSVPNTGDDSGGGGGDTPETLLARTGDLKARYDTGAHSGWVRANGRTIGDGSSGATERANEDCEDLFLLLWAVDANLTVSGGRGASAAGDWSASKTIELPSFRNRAIFGLGDMGNTNVALIDDSLFDNGNNVTLGSYGGVDDVTLTIAQMPSHDHTGTTTSNGAHSHSVNTSVDSGGGILYRGSNSGTVESQSTSSAGAHSHTLNINDRGGGEAHTNMPPFGLATIYIKL